LSELSGQAMLTMTPYIFIAPMLQLWQADRCFLCTLLLPYTAWY